MQLSDKQQALLMGISAFLIYVSRFTPPVGIDPNIVAGLGFLGVLGIAIKEYLGSAKAKVA